MNRKVKVLIVDDDPDVLLATSRIVKSAGHEVYEADTGAACIDVAKQKQPDLILLDVVLPDVDGKEICRQIKTNPGFGKAFVILISGLKFSSGEQADGLDIGADDYIVRPISNRELKARINAWIRIQKAEQERDRLINDLQDALEKVKQLSGLLPICSYCKKIRDDKGYWNRIEAFIQEHSDAKLSHSICEVCARKHFPDMDIY